MGSRAASTGAGIGGPDHPSPSMAPRRRRVDRARVRLAARGEGRGGSGEVTTYAEALAGFFVHESLLPDPPGIPHVRAFQRAQGEVCLDWLRVRLGG
jgi:hypothetical protein